MTPSLRSTRLILTPYAPSMVTQLHVDWLNDPDLMQFSEHRHETHDLGSQYAFTGGYHPERHLWLIRCDNTDIGSISAHLDKNNNHANLGILLGSREHQGQGLAAEAWCCVIDFLFESGVHKVECGCREDNHRMRRLAITTGFDEEGIVKQHFKVGDEYRNLVLYGRFRADKFKSEWNQMWDPNVRPFWKGQHE